MKTDFNISIQNSKLPMKKASKIMKQYKENFFIENSINEKRNNLYKLLKELNKKLKIVNCGIQLIDESRPLIKNKNERYWLKGLYIEHSRGIPIIKIWIRSETNRKLSDQIIFDLFLHEFIHHYEMKKLKIYVDHDKGFHNRLKYIKHIL